jgi:hypothetical protein
MSKQIAIKEPSQPQKSAAIRSQKKGLSNQTQSTAKKAEMNRQYLDSLLAANQVVSAQSKQITDKDKDDLVKRMTATKFLGTRHADFKTSFDFINDDHKEFFRKKLDVRKLSLISNRDLDYLIANLSTHTNRMQKESTNLTKVVSLNKLTQDLKDLQASNELKLFGFVGSSDATKGLSPEQIISALGLDYKNKNKTDFLKQIGTDKNNKPIYKAIPVTAYIKLPYSTDTLRQATRMTLDVRLHEKIVARSKQLSEQLAKQVIENKPLNKYQLMISDMAKQIAEANTSLTYKLGSRASQDASHFKQYQNYKLFNGEKASISQKGGPHTGTGFSSYGENLSSGYTNLYPEMSFGKGSLVDQKNKNDKEDKNEKENKGNTVTGRIGNKEGNFAKVMGKGSLVEFYAKFSNGNHSLTRKNYIDSRKPRGSTDILVGTWNGVALSVPDNAKQSLNSNFSRVKEQFPECADIISESEQEFMQFITASEAQKANSSLAKSSPEQVQQIQQAG